MKKLSFATLVASLVFSVSVFAAPVNINQASAEEIAESLSGIGTSKAQAIVAYREQNGVFRQASDITLVKGIGTATFEKNKMDILLK